MYLAPCCTLSLQEPDQTKKEYCCHGCTGFDESSFVCLERNQKRLCRLVGNELISILKSHPHRRNFARLSLPYRYIQSKYSDDLYSLVTQALAFITGKWYATYTNVNHSHFFCILVLGSRFLSDSFRPKIASLWNRLPVWY